MNRNFLMFDFSSVETNSWFSVFETNCARQFSHCAHTMMYKLNLCGLNSMIHRLLSHCKVFSASTSSHGEEQVKTKLEMFWHFNLQSSMRIAAILR
uniref:Putative ovule protein n=1 Tax=Solanum chacoense TaxID=4108 RepID=A0A0V0H4U2_SOLCH